MGPVYVYPIVSEQTMSLETYDSGRRKIVLVSGLNSIFTRDFLNYPAIIIGIILNPRYQGDKMNRAHPR